MMRAQGRAWACGDRSKLRLRAEHSFEFDLTIAGVSPGTYNFNVYGTVDGGRVATEADRIVVTGTGVPDSGSSLALLGLAISGLVGLRRKLAA